MSHFVSKLGVDYLYDGDLGGGSEDQLGRGRTTDRSKIFDTSKKLKMLFIWQQIVREVLHFLRTYR